MNFEKTAERSHRAGAAYCIFLFLTVVILLGSSLYPTFFVPRAWSQTSQLQPFDSKFQRAMWPRIYGQVGPYDVQTERELGDVAKAGFHFALLNDAAAFSGGVASYDISYIDTYANWEMYTLCHSEIVSQGSCSQTAQDAVMKGMAERVAKNASRDHMVGYWILDDYPGADIRPLLRRMHTLIARENEMAAFPRPTLCGFANIESTINFDPAACDIVVAYIYTAKNQSPQDWTLRQRLPRLLQSLREHGWDQRKTPLMGIVQAFGNYEGEPWALPSEEAVKEAAETYCEAGAIALLAYAWHDGVTKPGSSMRNTPSLVRGLQEGRKSCQQGYWSSN